MIVGLKGSGKTKALIKMVNEAGATSKGSVVCIEKGANLIHEIDRTVRLINAEEYNITTANSLYGFVCGVCASNYDITDIFIDGTLRICARDIALFTQFVNEASEFLKDKEVDLVMTVSIKPEDLPEELKKYMIA